jgi:retinal rod rhodopsin-sensitive cGMP 3',5'-cyclic phosphodiesterase subunit delta
VEVPAAMLGHNAIAREMTFSSKEAINGFRIHQRVVLNGQSLEEWNFKFGFVIPGSTNSWEMTIVAADAQEMLPASVLSGNMCIETTFFDDDYEIGRACARIYYLSAEQLEQRRKNANDDGDVDADLTDGDEI